MFILKYIKFTFISVLTGLCFSAFTSCYSPRLQINSRFTSGISGDQFYDSVIGKSREFREKLAMHEILRGNMPRFLKRFKKIKFIAESKGKRYRVELYVLPDYLSVGSKNFARIPLTPMTAQQIADSFHCFLPTTKIVDIIYSHADVKLKPVPMYAFRDSSVTMYQHHLIIEGQRGHRKGIIAGIKKDVVMTAKLSNLSHRVAIYGWHRLNGIPIQPLYTGHVDWYVDYSHGIRLVYEKIKINGQWMPYSEIINSPALHFILCDEEVCEVYHYPY